MTVVAAVAFMATRDPRSNGVSDSASPRPPVEDQRDGSTELTAATPLDISEPPSAYRIEYQVEDWAGGTRVTSTDRITVERPYRGRVEVQAGGSDAVSSLTVTAFGRVSFKGPDAQPLLVNTGPALAAFDLRVDPVLADAEQRGLLVRRERRKVLGQPCQVIRTRDPITAGALGSEPASGSEYTDSCIGSHGLVLEEVWVTGGKLLRRRLATDLELDPEIAEESFAAFGRHLEPREGGGSLRPVAPATFPSGAVFWHDLVVPEGFEFRGRYAVVPPQRSEATEVEALDQNPFAASASDRVGAVTDVWERGIDVLILEQGGTADRSKVFELEPGAPTVGVPELGTGQLILDGRFSEIRFPLTGGRYLRLLGTVPIEQLEDAATSLRRAPEGSGLVYLDDGSDALRGDEHDF